MICGDKADSAHVGGQVIHLVDPASDCQEAFVEFSQVQNLEFVRGRGFILWLLNVGSPNPMTFRLQPPNEMVANETASASYKNASIFRHVLRSFLANASYFCFQQARAGWRNTLLNPFMCRITETEDFRFRLASNLDRCNQEAIATARPIPQPKNGKEDKPCDREKSKNQNRVPKFAGGPPFLSKHSRDQGPGRPVSGRNLPDLRRLEPCFSQQLPQSHRRKMCDVKGSVPIDPGRSKYLPEPASVVRAANPRLS